MKKVKVLQVYRVRETDQIVSPGDILDYPESRAEELAAGGWIKILGDSDDPETVPAALTGIADNDAPPVDGEDGAGTDDEGDTDPAVTEGEEQQEEPATPVVPEKVEVITGQPEKVDTGDAKAKRGRKPKSEQQ